MDNLINLIERLGADSVLKDKPADAGRILQECEQDVQEAILRSDVAKLEALLDVRNKIVCMIFPAEEPKEQPEQPDEEEQPEVTKVSVAV